ncbi:hypothetical protein C8R43DRAFT_1135168 [Mycena crocata]|nr:hypothetical protein C8R43DRAFT_1135168 [Mycena crocata]
MQSQARHGSSRRHRTLKRDSQAPDFATRDVLEERDPSLINLPIPIPSIPIPIVKDILTVLVGGTTPKSTRTTAHTTSTTPASTPTTSAASGSGGGSGVSGSGSGSGDSGSGAGSSGSGNSSPGSSGSDSGSNSGSNSSSNSGSSGASQEDSSSDNSSVNASGSNASASSGSSAAASSDAAGGNGTGTKVPTGGVLAAQQSGGAGGGVVNVATNPADSMPTGATSFIVTGGKTVAVVGTVTFSDGLPTNTPTSNQTGGNGSPGSAATSSDSDGKHGGLPSFAVAIIGVVGSLLFLGLVIIAIRKRALRKRAARKEWWAGVVAPGSKSEVWSGRDSGGATAGDSSATRSIRSSFGTTFDHSEFSITFDDNPPAIPEIPHMVQIRGGPGLVPKGDSSMSGNGQPLSPISPISPDSPAIPIPLLVSIENSNVYSDASRRSSASSNISSVQYANYGTDDGSANHQMVPAGSTPTPMSVRPFSPSESFAFPIPPKEHRSGDWSLNFGSSPTTPTPANINALPQTTESLASSPPAAAPYAENPFADAFSVPVNTHSSRASAEFDAIETIWRPFDQTLQDEMSVAAADRVKVLAVYDDGWAMIERVGMGKGKGRAVDGQASVGLIPIDCMRKTEESVSSFLAAKRVSSVDATGYTAMAV